MKWRGKGPGRFSLSENGGAIGFSSVQVKGMGRNFFEPGIIPVSLVMFP